MDDKIVVGIGEVLWDMLPEGKQIGGAPANFAYHVSQFGLQSCVISAIGNDDLGDEIIESFAHKGLSSHIERVLFPSGTVAVALDGAGIPQYEICEGVAWDNIPFSEDMQALARRTQAVCFGSLAQRSEVSRETINRFIDAIPEENSPLIVFDVNLRQSFYSPEVLTQSMRRATVLKINDEELLKLHEIFTLREGGMESMARELMDRYDLRAVILTCGVEGSYVLTPFERSYEPTPRVEVMDTVGAGDSFTAAFVASILRGRSIEEAHKCAVEVSAYVCTQKGAMPVLPEELTR